MKRYLLPLVCLLSFPWENDGVAQALVEPCYKTATGCVPVTATTPLPVAPTSTSLAGVTPVVSASAESNHVLKASAGNLYAVYATGVTSGYLMVFDATSAPVDGAVTPKVCVPVSFAVNYAPGPPAAFGTGITAVISSTGCFTKTTSPTGFISGLVK